MKTIDDFKKIIPNIVEKFKNQEHEIGGYSFSVNECTNHFYYKEGDWEINIWYICTGDWRCSGDDYNEPFSAHLIKGHGWIDNLEVCTSDDIDDDDLNLCDNILTDIIEKELEEIYEY